MLDAETGELLSAEAYRAGVNWAKGIDMKTGRPIMNPAADYDKTGKGVHRQSRSSAARTTGSRCRSARRPGSCTSRRCRVSYPFVATHEDDNPMGQKLSISFAGSAEMLRDPKALRVNKGYLLAWDPVKQKEVWRVPHGRRAAAAARSRRRAGSCSPATRSNEFAAYRADTGEKLWGQRRADRRAWPGPSTYEVDGEQYVAVVAGFRQTGNYYAPNYSRLLVYKLGGTATLPEPRPFRRRC